MGLDDLMPELQGRYRDRDTGEVVTLLYYFRGLACVRDDHGRRWWMRWDSFWGFYLHMRAGESGRGGSRDGAGAEPI